MPHKPKRPCSWPGCPELTNGRFCPKHAKQEAQRYAKYERNPETRRRYGRAWQRVRKAYAEEHPLCEMCLAEGKVHPMEQVHHKVPLSEGGTNDYANLLSLCVFHHSQLHAARGDRWHNAKRDPGGAG